MPVEPAILKNYVKLIPGVPKKLVMEYSHIEPVTITDPKTKRPKTINRMVWKVYEEDGMTVTKYFTTPSEKLAQMLMAIWDKRTSDRICVIITEFGTDLAKDFEVRLC